MAISGRRWTVQDRDGNPIYLAEKRWQHIIGANNHPEMEDYEDHPKPTIQQGHRRQEPLTLRKYGYVRYSPICQRGSITLWQLCFLALMSMLRGR